ncbi:MAG: IclR family transcriptional regulator domain-containing protein [Gaiellaceae bacterium]
MLGYELSRLARAADPFAAFVDRAQPHLEALASRTGESATISHARPPDTLEVIAQADAPTFVGLKNWLGRSFSMHASASGKLALALALDDDAIRSYADAGLEQLTPRTITDPSAFVKELARIRRSGYATTVDELEEGLAGATILLAELSAGGLLIIGLAGPSSRLDARLRREVLPVLREFAERIRPLL